MSDEALLPVYRENDDWVVRPRYVMTYLQANVEEYGHQIALAHAYMTAAQLMADTAKALLTGAIRAVPEVPNAAPTVDPSAPKVD